MTKEEAIKYLKKMKDECNDTFHKVRYITREEALDMAIKALETLEEFEKAQIINGGRLNGRTYAYKCGLEDGKRKALEQQLCEDCISRKAVLDEMKIRRANGDMITAGFIKGLPPVTPKPKTGHWIIKEGREQGYDIAGIKTWYIQIMCDKCGFIKTAIEGHTGQYHFCPNCGAKMLPADSEKER